MKKEIKVYEGRDKKGNPIPQIRLQGKWLEEIGFNIGSAMGIDYKSGKIILTVQIDK